MTTRPHIADLLEDTLDQIEAAGSTNLPDNVVRKRPESIPSIETGLQDLDLILNGIRPALVHLIFGYPGVGKSILAANFARAAAGTGHRVLYLSAPNPRDHPKNSVCRRKNTASPFARRTNDR